MLITKQGVRFGGFTKELVEILYALVRIAESYEVDLVITSASDGKHMEGSKHYTYKAIDLRSKNIQNAGQLVGQIQAALGKDYRVLLEDRGNPNEHIHIQSK